MIGKFDGWLVLSYCLLLAWLLGFAIIVGINSGWVYHLCVLQLHLDQHFHVSVATLQRNLNQMIAYIQLPWKQSMHLQVYQLSPAAQSHFRDVKGLVEKIELGFILLTGWLGWAIFKRQLNRQIWRLEGLLNVTIVGLIVVAGLLLVDFQDCFIYFHRLVFRNQNWIFNPRVDPIINVLPDQYFAAAFGLIAITFLVALLMLRIIAYHQLKKAGS
ncbi:TIGR01906 family membrane protein [Fructilactobacillus carniphilus]|uniref:TIGR01906 family membrane protein n=1 Tax=Fructilactobacillus carniphilus TaxID=2940297 RepID=A0ABY5BYR5_9LACO|nr:TIGR01906 family membrane protein [Fructilactobacillus carniphilus]USS91217.1 TIGR01906 family membrane protein [Fructilactobacillus carniphilus]